MELKTKAIEGNEDLPGVRFIEGYAYDVNTGELLYAAERGEGFKVDDQRSAEWLGEKLMGLDADIAALELQKQAVTQNVDRMVADKKRHKDGMLYRYGPQLEAFAKANLPKGKRTWTCPFVSVAFRTVKAGFKVRDDGIALEWAKAFCPDAVQTKESFLTSKVSDETKMLNIDIFDPVPERETCKIESGLEDLRFKLASQQHAREKQEAQ